MKKFTTLLFFSIILLILTACGGSEGESKNGSSVTTVKKEQDKVIQYQSSAGAVSYAELAYALGYLGDIKLEKVSDYKGGPESIQLTATGEVDFGGAFNGAIVKSIAQGVNIKSVISYYGSDKDTYAGYYTLENSDINEARDLIGKKVGVNILGAHAEFAIKQYLRDNGLTEKEIEKVELVVIPSSSAEQILRAGQVDVVSLSGVARDKALETGGIKLLFKDIDLFGEFVAGTYFFNNKYIEENPDTVRTFVDGVARAIEWARITPREEVIAKYEEIIKARPGNETMDNLKYWLSTGIANEGGSIKEKDFQIWIDWLVKNGDLKEGQVKLEDLYTNEFNPYAKE